MSSAQKLFKDRLISHFKLLNRYLRYLFLGNTSRLATLVAVAVIGFTSGAGQTAALTAMLRRARTPRATETASAGWNIAFNGGLGVGAVVAGWVTIQGQLQTEPFRHEEFSHLRHHEIIEPVRHMLRKGKR